MKNKLQILGMFLFLSYIGSAQTLFNAESLKYWYYRDRLKYFVMPGTEPGQSVVITCRNSIKDFGDYNPIFCGIETAQTHKLLGYYIGMLATEYKLLKDNGQTVDANNTLLELNLAMEALTRMDECEMDIPWNKDENKNNGFFIRDDFPPILSPSMIEYFNQDLACGRYCDYIAQISGIPSQNIPGRPGLPFAIAETCASVRKKYESTANYYYSHPHHWTDKNDIEHVFDIADYSLEDDGDAYMDYWRQECFTSNDEIIGDLMGLALVSFLVDDESTQDKAYDIALRYKQFMMSNPSLLMFFPDFHPISPGGYTGGFVWGVAKLVHRMGNNFPISNYGVGPIATLQYKIGLLGQLWINPEENTYNKGLYSKLVALGEATTYGYSSHNAIRILGSDDNFSTFYLLLWAVANNKDLKNSNFEYPFSMLVNDLNTAPCGGPYNYVHYFGLNQNYSSTGWCTEYKYDSDLASQQDNAAGHNGAYPGLDYMLLYNLACLAFPTGFDYNGQHYSFPYYFNQINRNVAGKYAPLVVPGSPSLEISSTNNPEEIRAITSITSDMIVSNRAQLQLPMNYQSDTYIDGVFGDVTLKAGESIKLTDGFRVDAGAHFLARIESYSCNNVSYKNMAAPPWSENYKGSYYDTLISVPMEKRAPIVYSEDNYVDEEFDMSLWEDYYYMYDTTAVTELAVGAWLNPNPCGSSATLTVVSENEQQLTIELYDMTGIKRETVFNDIADQNLVLDLNLSTYASGTYMLRITGSGGMKVMRFVKE